MDRKLILPSTLCPESHRDSAQFYSCFGSGRFSHVNISEKINYQSILKQRPKLFGYSYRINYGENIKNKDNKL